MEMAGLGNTRSMAVRIPVNGRISVDAEMWVIRQFRP